MSQRVMVGNTENEKKQKNEIKRRIKDRTMKKTIELTLEQAREMLGKDEAMDALIRANFTEQELKSVKRWEDLGEIDGWYIWSIDSVIYESETVRCEPSNKKTFAKKTQAEGVLAMAQLSQLMKDVNGDWTPDWTLGNGTKKYCIQYSTGKITKDAWSEISQFLAFPTREIRDKFAEDHRELILEYFKIYQ